MYFSEFASKIYTPAYLSTAIAMGAGERSPRVTTDLEADRHAHLSPAALAFPLTQEAGSRLLTSAQRGDATS